MFGRSGFRGSSIREIADKVGLSETGVLHHFGGKGNLLLAVLEERDAVDQRRLVSETPDVFHSTRDVVAKNATTPGVTRLFATLSAEATDEEHPAHQFFQERYARLMKDMAGRYRSMTDAGTLPDGINADLATRVTFAVLDGLQIQWLLNPELDMETAFADFLRHYFGVDLPTTDPSG